MSAPISDGARVQFREDTPQHKANAGIVYVVNGETHATAAWGRTATGEPREYVWLVHADDVDKAPSRQRRRSGWTDALEVAP